MEIMPTHFFRFFIFFWGNDKFVLNGWRSNVVSLGQFSLPGWSWCNSFFFLFGVCSGFYLIRWLTRFSSLSLSSHWWLMELHSCWAEMCFSPTCRPDPQKFVNGPPASTVDKICCFFANNCLIFVERKQQKWWQFDLKTFVLCWFVFSLNLVNWLLSVWIF